MKRKPIGEIFTCPKCQYKMVLMRHKDDKDKQYCPRCKREMILEPQTEVEV